MPTIANERLEVQSLILSSSQCLKIFGCKIVEVKDGVCVMSNFRVDGRMTWAR